MLGDDVTALERAVRPFEHAAKLVVDDVMLLVDGVTLLGGASPWRTRDVALLGRGGTLLLDP